MTELLALGGADSLVLVGQKRDRDKTRPSLRDFCSWPVRARWQFLHLLVGNWFRMDYALFASVKAGSAIIEKVLLCSGDRRKQARADLIDLIEVFS